MASLRDGRRRGPALRAAAAAGEERRVAVRLESPAERRAEIERRVRALSLEETRLAREGFVEGAQAAARERRYWEFLRALTHAPLAPRRAPGTVH